MIKLECPLESVYHMCVMPGILNLNLQEVVLGNLVKIIWNMTDLKNIGKIRI